MNLKLTLAALVILPLALTACAKKDEAPKTETAASAAVEEQTTPEQQKAIDALDKPVLDEKNTDVPAEVANAPADEATAATDDAASIATAQ
ncbi:hypothetical protein [Acinetobacter sp. CS-2]|uniref:hypothetical protein n=1 Tax=Acinetobacter sp. CS-2 TaxID=2798861 RepID=UPI0019037C19|nr:hypothetical protein [Acinetobacter sp. CS-2]QQN40654.1 hypothetical protein JFY49_07080 [Acinetobacter sp. CS-2]